MRINRPDGISQENRSHPFFIMLRKFADSQKDEAIYTSRDFVYTAIVQIVFPIITMSMAFLDPLFIIVGVGLLLVSLGMIRHRYKTLQTLLSTTIFQDVDYMIHSNDFQLSNLNMEKIINDITRCAETTGRLKAFQDQSNLMRWAVIAVSCICTLMSALVYFLR